MEGGSRGREGGRGVRERGRERSEGEREGGEGREREESRLRCVVLVAYGGVAKQVSE